MVEFLNDLAGISLLIGILSIYYGLSMYKWSIGWRIIAAPLAILGVLEVGLSFSVYVDATMGLLTVLLFGGVVSFALFRIGQENA